MTNQPEERPPGLRYPDSDDFPTGPDIGERLPDITLPAPHGKLLYLEEARGEGRPLVVFHRSVRW